MHGDDLGVGHIATPIETGGLVLLERGEYRILDVILMDTGPLYALVRAQPAHVRPVGTR